MKDLTAIGYFLIVCFAFIAGLDRAVRHELIVIPVGEWLNRRAQRKLEALVDKIERWRKADRWQAAINHLAVPIMSDGRCAYPAGAPAGRA